MGYPNLEAELKKLEFQPQRQDSTLDQLASLLPFAVKLGLYDAADLIKNIIQQRSSKA